MTKIIIDQHPAHLLLGSKKPVSETTLTGMPDTLYIALSNGDRNLLTKHGINVIVANGQRHSQVGLCESVVYNVKKTFNDALSHLPPCC